MNSPNQSLKMKVLQHFEKHPLYCVPAGCNNDLQCVFVLPKKLRLDLETRSLQSFLLPSNRLLTFNETVFQWTFWQQSGWKLKA